MKTIKVIDIINDKTAEDSEVFDQSHEISCILFNNSNDSYYDYRIGMFDDEEEYPSEYYNYKTDKLDAMLRRLGVEENEEVLIFHWW